jgi:hypothetical protein
MNLLKETPKKTSTNDEKKRTPVKVIKPTEECLEIAVSLLHIIL